MKEEGNALSFHKTRLAPTPSGFLHLGNAMSFLLTTILAKKANAKLLLRIDDLDRDRLQKKYVEDIFETLRFLGIDWNEGPENYEAYEAVYSQIHRMNLYKTALQQLRDNGHVFACGCSRMQWQQGVVCTCREKNISLDAQNVSWRLITDAILPLTVKSLDGEMIATALPLSVQSFVVRRKNGFPSYQLSSLIDDEYFGVDAIVRGQDLWDSTLAQQYLALTMKKSFFKEVKFYHHPLVMEAGGDSKLSKSAGATSIRHLRKEGKSKEEVTKMIELISDDLCHLKK